MAARTRLKDHVQDELKRAQITLAKQENELIMYQDTYYSKEIEINTLKNNMEDAQAKINANQACIAQVEAVARH